MNGWQRSGRSADGKALRACSRPSDGRSACWTGLADSSPLLWDLVSGRAGAAAVAADGQSPERHLGAVAGERQRRPSLLPKTIDEAMRILRRMKAEAALLIALADIGGVWPVMRATQALTELADTAVAPRCASCCATPRARAGSSPPTRRSPRSAAATSCSPWARWARFELNYSSDIDLIVFFDPDSAGAGRQGRKRRRFYVRITRGLVKLLQERTGDGYVFRTDLRLRPDPASTQIAISTDAAIDYYESVGQNWERAAMIKARACAGDIAAGEAILAELAPFVWRKYLDLRRRRRRPRDEAADQRLSRPRRDRGRGPQHQARPRRHPRDRVLRADPAVDRRRPASGTARPRDAGDARRLAEGGWIGAAARDRSEAAYRFLRTVEHRLQMVADEQTQTLPADREGLERFARFLGFKDRDAFAEVLLGHLRKVQRHYASCSRTARRGRRAGACVSRRRRRPRDARPARRDGFSQPLEISATVRRWLAGELSVAARRVRPHAVRRAGADAARPLGRAENPDAALVPSTVPRRSACAARGCSRCCGRIRI